MIKLFETLVKAVKVVIDGVEQTLNLAGNILTAGSTLLNNLPYILAGGIAIFSGVQIYGKHKNGKFYGTDTVKKLTNTKLTVG
jgi:hypothetical protein